MARLKYNAAVKIGEYEAHGQKKNRYQRIGRIMQGDTGPFLLLDTLFISPQLFALANKDLKDSIIVSLFEEKTKEEVSNVDTHGDSVVSADIPF